MGVVRAGGGIILSQEGDYWGSVEIRRSRGEGGDHPVMYERDKELPPLSTRLG